MVGVLTRGARILSLDAKISLPHGKIVMPPYRLPRQACDQVSRVVASARAGVRQIPLERPPRDVEYGPKLGRDGLLRQPGASGSMMRNPASLAVLMAVSGVILTLRSRELAESATIRAPLARIKDVGMVPANLAMSDHPRVLAPERSERSMSGSVIR